MLAKVGRKMLAMLIVSTCVWVQTPCEKLVKKDLSVTTKSVNLKASVAAETMSGKSTDEFLA